MGTKSEWRNNMLRFHGDAMYTAVASQTTNVRVTGVGVDTPTVAVACPIYSGTLSTAGNMHFHGRIAGVCASSTASVIASLRYGTTTILTCSVPLASTCRKHQASNLPYNFDFYGRFAKASSSGLVTATCVGTMGRTTRFTRCVGTTGSTAARTKFASTDINNVGNSTLGLNIVISLLSTAGGAGTVSAFTNTVGFIELLSG